MNKYWVEFLGTAFLAFVFLSTRHWIATGAALAIAMLLGGPISGGMFNPALVVANYNLGRVSRNDVIPLVAVQMLGALFAWYSFRKFLNAPAS